MILAQHGGECCGIRHIHTLGWSPSATVSITEGNGRGFENPWMPTESRKQIFTGSQPPETAGERLKRFIHFCERFRPQGIIEVVTCNNWEESEEANDFWDSCDDDPPENTTNTRDGQTEEWRELLVELNFREVNICRNSNTGNHVTVWHRNSGEVPKLPDPDGKKPKKKAADPFK